jgi:hypothetical protein
MSDLLRLALHARIPIVKITSDDADHLEDLLKHLASGRQVAGLGVMAQQPNRWKPKHIYYGVGDNVPREIDYADLLDKEITLVVVNPDEGTWLNARDCGALVPPVDYVEEQLSSWLPKKQVQKYGRYFVGMSMRDVIETIMLTQTRDGSLSATGINETKSYLGAGLPGLEALDVGFGMEYVPPDWAVDWLNIDAKLLVNSKFRELWPKGFMLFGPTGTGKTEMARYIARILGWPLYRLDMGTLYSRWQGESERNLSRVLSFISGQGESVFLLDEAEKLFGNEAVGQASLTTLLSMLLWWMQGETNRTITVMTSNKLEVIPPELYRPGRLDAVHEMRGLETEEQLTLFKEVVAERLATTFDLDPDSLAASVEWQSQPISQAAVVAKLRSEAKKMLVGE